MNPEFPHLTPEELEVRITALLLGELSAAEAEAVRERIAADAQLQQLHDQLQKTIGLVEQTTASVGSKATTTAKAPTLSYARREKLFAAFKTHRLQQQIASRRTRRELLAIAAMVLGLVAVTAVMFRSQIFDGLHKEKVADSKAYYGAVGRVPVTERVVVQHAMTEPVADSEGKDVSLMVSGGTFVGQQSELAGIVTAYDAASEPLKLKGGDASEKAPSGRALTELDLRSTSPANSTVLGGEGFGVAANNPTRIALPSLPPAATPGGKPDELNSQSGGVVAHNSGRIALPSTSSAASVSGEPSAPTSFGVVEGVSGSKDNRVLPLPEDRIVQTDLDLSHTSLGTAPPPGPTITFNNRRRADSQVPGMKPDDTTLAGGFGGVGGGGAAGFGNRLFNKVERPPSAQSNGSGQLSDLDYPTIAPEFGTATAPPPPPTTPVGKPGELKSQNGRVELRTGAASNPVVAFSDDSIEGFAVNGETPKPSTAFGNNVLQDSIRDLDADAIAITTNATVGLASSSVGAFGSGGGGFGGNLWDASGLIPGQYQNGGAPRFAIGEPNTPGGTRRSEEQRRNWLTTSRNDVDKPTASESTRTSQGIGGPMDLSKHGDGLSEQNTSLPIEAKKPVVQDSLKISGEVQEAKELYEAGKYAEAGQKLEQVLKEDPQNKAGHYYFQLSQDAQNPNPDQARGSWSKQTFPESRTRVTNMVAPPDQTPGKESGGLATNSKSDSGANVYSVRALGGVIKSELNGTSIVQLPELAQSILSTQPRNGTDQLAQGTQNAWSDRWGRQSAPQSGDRSTRNSVVASGTTPAENATPLTNVNLTGYITFDNRAGITAETSKPEVLFKLSPKIELPKAAEPDSREKTLASDEGQIRESEEAITRQTKELDSKKKPGGAVNQVTDLSGAMDRYGELTGRTIVRPPMPEKIVKENSPALTPDQEKQLLDSVLEMNEITLIPQGEKTIKALPQPQSTVEAAITGLPAESKELQGPSTTLVYTFTNANGRVIDEALKRAGGNGPALARIPNSSTVVARNTPEKIEEIRKAFKNADAQNYDEPPPPVQRTSAPIPQPDLQTVDNAFSTFSLNVSDVSFKLAAASLEKGVMPDPASIRSEEFINAFDYRDPEAPPGVPIAFNWDRAAYPFAHNRDILRFSLKTAARGRERGKPLNLVLLLDNSGSMERADRVRIIHECLRVLAGKLQPQDRVSAVSFSRQARLWLDGIPGDQASDLPQRIGSLTPEGGTNLEEAMRVAYQAALKHYMKNGANRIVLLTDGAANLGNVNPDALKKTVETHRMQGIALDCFGVGWEGYNDDLLEVLSRNGDGRYGFVNTPEAASTEFASQLAGALQVAASDVKVQVEFNPRRVTSYRQIGYAKHQLKKEQFRDNTVDAAEIGAAEAGNALYVVDVNPSGEGPLATVRVRYKVPGTSEYHEKEWPVPYNGAAKSLDQATPAIRLASIASAFSEWLASSPYGGEVTPSKLLNYLPGAIETFNADPRPKKLEWMIREASRLSGNTR
jgi:Mg-chelatase subunit ChlD